MLINPWISMTFLRRDPPKSARMTFHWPLHKKMQGISRFSMPQLPSFAKTPPTFSWLCFLGSPSRWGDSNQGLSRIGPDAWAGTLVKTRLSSSDPHRGRYCDMYFAILSDIYSDTLIDWHSIWHFIPHFTGLLSGIVSDNGILSGMWSGISSEISSGILSCYLIYVIYRYLHMYLHNRIKSLKEI